MNIEDVVLGLAAGVGIDLSPDGKTAYYVEWAIGELSKVDVATGVVEKVKDGLTFPQDVELDWDSMEIFVSERTGAIVKQDPNGESYTLVKPGGAPHQLALVKRLNKRHLYTVCFESGRLLRIDVDTRSVNQIVAGLGHPVGLVIDDAEQYAFVTEQDAGSLTQVDLASGAVQRIHQGLVSPFFLAWDASGKNIFCIERDPANRLVRLDLGAIVTQTTVANGLDVRPSGVAPNDDDSLIYTCADRELEVISFRAGPHVHPKPTPTPFTLHSIEFNYDGSAAISLKDHKTGMDIATPEYVAGGGNAPSAYLARAVPKVKVILRKRPGFSGGDYAIGATGSLGGVRRRYVRPVFHASGLSDPIEFSFLWPLQPSVQKLDVSLDWYAREATGPARPVPIGSATHRIYVLIGRPTEPWVSEKPWVEALELACGWAANASSAADVATRITEGYYRSGRLSYDIVNGATFYSPNGSNHFSLSEMLERLNGGYGLGEKVNCTDSANTVSTLSNLLGCDLWQSRMGWHFDLNPILAVGYPPPNPMPTWPGFSYHEVAWEGACTENDRLFDGCLSVDGDSDPSSAPHQWLLPTNMLFGDCASMGYRLRLSPPTAGGCSACTPQTSTRRRRRIT